MTIVYQPIFEKRYRNLPEPVKRLAEQKEVLFSKNPFDPRLRTHKLHGKFKDLYAFSINRSYRIIFDFISADIVRFHTIGKHDIYG